MRKLIPSETTLALFYRRLRANGVPKEVAEEKIEKFRRTRSNS